MTEAAVILSNKLGLHARPSAKVSQLASSFKSDVWLARGSRKINAKSIMGVMMLAAPQGSSLSVSAEGVDEAQAVQALVDLFASGFGEPG
ncbi:MAG: HPr family phosphocarrier protein [Betaproteobacteria bacterium]|nr:HPr family phosphocarrier protein [Pseudomonadota bacterium]NBO11801.1 HPr family phosphocarrier protein [Betaproteobacteria bacterium]NBO43627.1 HPr family phosphocarrier protein [Betaproteobacteria bacterium]NBP10437.1 HPr family phosphocarrier protein [Betaproteobacteria bacterium]NBP61037.1 HPr family phosphocarrier protein [Betaproteobacteria bacterium]